MALTPLDIEKFELRTGFRGYAREDVERFRYEALRSVEDYLARISALQARVGELERDLQQYRANEDLLKSSVVLAQKTSDELITAARQRAELIVREAEAEGEVIRRRLADIRNEREQFEYAFHGLLSGFLHRLEQGNPSLKPEPPAALPSPGEPRNAEPNPGHVTQVDQPKQDMPSQETVPIASTPSEYTFGSFTLEERPASAPRPAPVMPGRSAGTPAPVNERDHDINDFSAALDSAPVQPSPPRVNAREHGGLPLTEEAPATPLEEPVPRDDTHAMAEPLPWEPAPDAGGDED